MCSLLNLRASKEFSDMHGLIMHTYHSDNANLLPDHLGLHKALCVLMGWNYSEPPDDSKSYQNLSAAEVAENQNDLIMWPPLVIIHNTCTGKNKEGRVEGLGNKAMDARLKGNISCSVVIVARRYHLINFHLVVILIAVRDFIIIIFRFQVGIAFKY